MGERDYEEDWDVMFCEVCREEDVRGTEAGRKQNVFYADKICVMMRREVAGVKSADI